MNVDNDGDRKGRIMIKENKIRLDRCFKCIVFPVLIVGNFLLIFNESIWYDEVYSLNLVKGSLFEIIKGTAQDVHPPLYYLILKLGLIVGNQGLGINSIYVSKFISLIPIFLTVIIDCFWLKKWIAESAWIHCFCILTMPRIISHAGIEIRMYSWAALFIYIAFLCAVNIIKSSAGKKFWYILSISSLAASYCHYFACIAAFFVYVGLLVFILFSEDRAGRLKKFFCSGISVFIGYLPWLVVLVGQLRVVGNDYWISRLGRSECIRIIEFPFGDNATPTDMICFVLLFASALLSLLSLKKIFKYIDVKMAFFALSILALTVITGVGVSRAFRPVFLPRYMIPTLFSFWLGIILLVREAGIVRKIFIIAMLIIGGMYSFIRLYLNENYLSNQVTQMLNTIEVNSENGKEIKYVTDNRHLYYVLDYYCGETQQVYLLRKNEGWESEEGFINAKYAIALKDGFLDEYIEASWGDLGEYRLELYDTIVYENNVR